MKYFFTLLLLASFQSIHAQAPTEKTLLWQVTGNGVQQPSYLFGTLHLMCPDKLSMPETVKTKFRSTKQLFLEVDMDDPNMVTEMMNGMRMSQDTTLELLLDQHFDSINHRFKEVTGLPLNMMNTTKPLLLMAMIYPKLLGCQPVSWESEFLKMAKENNMNVEGLELIADQVKVFESIPYAVQADMLRKTLMNMDSTKQVFIQLMQMYQEKDIRQMYETTTADRDFGPYQGVLLNNRNHNWIPVIGEQAKKQPTFFAFGAGHLGGDEGVISLLRKNGFIVTPVFY